MASRPPSFLWRRHTSVYPSGTSRPTTTPCLTTSTTDDTSAPAPTSNRAALGDGFGPMPTRSNGVRQWSRKPCLGTRVHHGLRVHTRRPGPRLARIDQSSIHQLGKVLHRLELDDQAESSHAADRTATPVEPALLDQLQCNLRVSPCHCRVQRDSGVADGSVQRHPGVADGSVNSESAFARRSNLTMSMWPISAVPKRGVDPTSRRRSTFAPGLISESNMSTKKKGKYLNCETVRRRRHGLTSPGRANDVRSPRFRRS